MTIARAGALGRAPMREDLEAALALCGYGYDALEEVIEDRERWKAAVPHEGRPGQTAVSEADRDLLVRNPVRSVSCWPARGHPGTSTSFPVLMKIVRIKAGDDIAYGVADVEGVLVYIGSRSSPGSRRRRSSLGTPPTSWRRCSRQGGGRGAQLRRSRCGARRGCPRGATHLPQAGDVGCRTRRKCRSPRPSRRTSTMRQSSRQ